MSRAAACLPLLSLLACACAGAMDPLPSDLADAGDGPDGDLFAGPPPPAKPRPGADAGAAEPPAGPCRGLDAAGACKGDVALWCEAGALRQVDCAEAGGACGWDPEAGSHRCGRAAAPPLPEPDAPCRGLDARGVCDSGVARWCAGGAPQASDCVALGRRCVAGDEAGPVRCVADAPGEPPEDPGPGPDDPEVPPEEDACGGLDFLGACEGDRAVWCHEGERLTVDCAADGLTCDWIDDQTGFFCRGDGPPPEDPPAGGCGDLDFLGRCDGQVAVWCGGEAVQRVDCAASGQACAWIDEQTGFFCRAPAAEPVPEPPPADDCGGLDFLGRCEGQVAVWCAGGSVQRLDCAARGESCGWIDDQTGYFCRADAPGG